MAGFLFLPDWFWHPLRVGNGLNFWSGIGSDIGEVSIVAAVAAMLATFWRQHNCHVHKCPRLSWHPHPDHGHPVCRHHHPESRAIRA